MKRTKCILICLLLALACLLCGCMRYETPHYTIESTDENGIRYLLFYSEKTIRYDNVTYTYTVDGIGTEDPTVTVYYPNGATYNSNADTAGWSGDYDETQYASGEVLIGLIRPAYVGKRVGPGPVNYILGLFLLVSGVIAVIWPQLAWELSHMFNAWQYENHDPSEGGLAMTRFGGACEIVLAVVAFFMNWS